MRKGIGITIVLSLCLCGFSAPKVSKQSAPSTGILVVSNYAFQIQGDGISTTFNITPHNIPQVVAYGPGVPHLPLVGMISGSGTCINNITFTGSVSGQQLAMSFSTPPPVDVVQFCNAVLLFQPQ